jgi:7-keto-8-aminopelargonate synthetase-like enzyme
MTHHLPDTKIPAPCIINTGVIVNKLDMRRLLTDLGRVHYVYTLDGVVHSEGDGDVMEVFANQQRSTLVANQALYLNVCSFDYLELKQTPEKQTHFELVQESWRLCLIPLSTPSQERRERNLNVTAMEAMMEQVLSARWDAEFDDDSSDMF